MSKKILIGTCGIPVRKEEIYRNLDAVEIQETFYNLIPLERAGKILLERPEGFVVAAKVFQAITHPSTSPTWRKMRGRLEGDLSMYGDLKPSRENLNAWEKFLNIAKAMRAEIAVFQTPPSFGYSAENYSNVVEFFRSIDRGGLKIAWEPRGSWNKPDNRDILCRIYEDLGVIQALDIFRNKPCTGSQDSLYIRLHGIGAGEVNYRYRYSDEDLIRLRDMILETHHRTIYIMFNNVYMYEDAVRMKKLLKTLGEGVEA
ncbi:MAG: DUF72 domain-containing protein [Sulfolobales archaeon]